MADNNSGSESSDSSDIDITPNEAKLNEASDLRKSDVHRTRKRKLTPKEKAEKSERLSKERNKRKAEKKRKKRNPHASSVVTRTYGTGITDGPRKSYTRKTEPEPDAHNAIPTVVKETELSELPSRSPTQLSLIEQQMVFSTTPDELLPTSQTEVQSIICAEVPLLNTDNLTIAEVNSKQSVTIRNKDDPLAWMVNEDRIFRALVDSYTTNQFSCGVCNTNSIDGIIKCTDCCTYFCYKCDRKSHSCNPYHARTFFRGDFTCKLLLPTEFISAQGIVEDISKCCYIKYI